MGWFDTFYYVCLGTIFLGGATAATTVGVVKSSLRDAYAWLIYIWVISFAIFGSLGHLIFSKQITESLNWAASPFENELAFLQLGIAVWALLAVNFNMDAAIYLAGAYGTFLASAGVQHLFLNPSTAELVIALVDIVVGATLIIIGGILI
jgi:hypothetical protein